MKDTYDMYIIYILLYIYNSSCVLHCRNADGQVSFFYRYQLYKWLLISFVLDFLNTDPQAGWKILKIDVPFTGPHGKPHNVNLARTSTPQCCGKKVWCGPRFLRNFGHHFILGFSRIAGINETGNYMPNGQPLSVWHLGWNRGWGDLHPIEINDLRGLVGDHHLIISFILSAKVKQTFNQ